MMLLLIIVIIILYLYTTRNHSYWAKRGVKHERPIPFFGNHLPNILLQRDNTDLGLQMYNAYENEKIVGYYIGNIPQLIIRDPEIIKHMLNIDFNSFSERGLNLNPKKESLLNNLFFVSGDNWRRMRNIFSGAFTSVKLKAVFPLIVKCTDKLVKKTTMRHVSDEIKTYELMTGYTMEFIASCGFGVDVDTISESNMHFVDVARSFFDKTSLQTFMINLDEICSILKIIPGTFEVNSEFNSFILNITKKVLAERNFKPSERNDFVDHLLQMVYWNGNEKLTTEADLESDSWFVAAQVFLFLVAGFETSAVATSVVLHQLAYNQNLQDEVRKEIDSALKKYDNKLCYEAVCEMSLLDMTLKESLRIQPPAGFIRRRCIKEYKIPGTNIAIDPGVKILIPIKALNHDPKYFDCPSEFRPQRFSPEAEQNIPKFVYMPFGSGPRTCPGARLASLQSMAGLASLLHHFVVEPTPNTSRHYKIKRSAFLVQIIEGGIPLYFKPRTNK
ncbi:cytochrome P450 6B2-like [Bombyx mori]|uniref:unspecific monooxygenase n=1 Tax=Bombyx mori TaxID=7091 RepID=A0A8R2LZZ5_BOMMO|nr:cytochrome P450 6B2-like [Bombyx mori]